MKLGNSGMTLVETMVTLGIATTMMLGILDLVNYSNKAAKNTSINSDWNSVLANVQNLLNNSMACGQAMRQVGSLTSTAVGGTTVVTGLVAVSGANSNVILTTTSSAIPPRGQYESFLVPGATGIKMSPTAPAQTISMVQGGSVKTFYVYQMQMNLAAIKMRGNTANILGAPVLTNQFPISFQLITGPNSTTTIYDCFGHDMASAQACQDLGGVYNYANTPKCVINPTLYLNQTGLSADTATGGEKFQMWGVPGTPAVNDVSIGVDGSGTSPKGMWFNSQAGPNYSTMYSFHSTGGIYGSSDLAQLSIVVPNGGGAHGADLNIGSNLYDGLGYPLHYASVSFGGTPSGGNGGQTTGERIGSARNSGHANQYGLDFQTGFVTRVQITNGGDTFLGASSNPIKFTTTWSSYPDNMTNGAEISNDTNLFKTLMIVGNRSGMQAQVGAPGGIARRVSIWDRLDVNGYLLVNGWADFKNAGGNPVHVFGDFQVDGTFNFNGNFGGNPTFTGNVTVKGGANMGFVNVVNNYGTGQNGAPPRSSPDMTNCASWGGGCNWDQGDATCPPNTNLMGGFCGTGPPEYPSASLHNAFITSASTMTCFAQANHGHAYYMRVTCSRITGP